MFTVLFENQYLFYLCALYVVICLWPFQEFHLSQPYHEGLRKLQAKEYEKARELLEAVLKDPLISKAQVLLALKGLPV